jgi:hypothetical protein
MFHGSPQSRQFRNESELYLSAKTPSTAILGLPIEFGGVLQTGHSLADVEAILDAHYLGRTTGLAEAAMVKLEKAQGSGSGLRSAQSSRRKS